MEKQIPLYFDSVVVESPFQGISDADPNVGRLKVRVFTKYKNRNGSYITDAVAEQLIESATQGTTPVVGFFDPESQSWASHTGPTLANGYGYVEKFLGWEPFEDTDGVQREYAVFSVILFTDYFEEARKVLGQNQSMELNPDTITGEWALVDGEEYYIYKTAKMLGFCIIGEHEPCFSVSSFFSKNDDQYDAQYEKFSSLLFDLKAKVEEAEKNDKGGEQTMDNFENEVVETQVPEEQKTENFQETVVEEPAANEPEDFNNAEPAEVAAEPTEEPVAAEAAADEPSEFDALQEQFNALQSSFNELQENFNAAQARIAELEEFQSNANTELETLRATNAELQTTVANYEAEAVKAEGERKIELVEKYEKIMSEEEIKPIRDVMNDFSYDELESKLAISFANKQMAGSEVKKVPLPDAPESQFALLMKKYRK